MNKIGIKNLLAVYSLLVFFTKKGFVSVKTK